MYDEQNTDCILRSTNTYLLISNRLNDEKLHSKKNKKIKINETNEH